MLWQCVLGICFGETATFIGKNGQVEFGEFRRMSADSVYFERNGSGSARESAVLSRKSLSEVVFDSGEKLNLALPEFPIPAVVESGKEASPPPVRAEKASVAAFTPSAGPCAGAGVTAAPRVSPFAYAGISAVVPGLGQLLLGKRAKGAACFGVVGLSFLGASLAWSATTDSYGDLQKNKSPGGSYREADFRKFTFRLHGSQALTGVAAALYVLTIADAAADGFYLNRHPVAIRPLVTVSSTDAGITLALAF
jgi:hypothetical protein